MSIAVRSITETSEWTPDERVNRDGNARRQPVHRDELMPMQDVVSRESIELCAYFAAEKRGFAPGHESADWLEAEALLLDRWFTEQRGK